MRLLRKRITCVNRSDCDKNNEAIDKVQARYMDKMKKKGWELYISASSRNGNVTQGNQFFVYERYFTMVKYNKNESEIREKNIKECTEEYQWYFDKFGYGFTGIGDNNAGEIK